MSNIKKKIILLTLLFISAIIFCGSTSAASDAYDTGQESAQKAIADNDLGFNDADSTLVITNAGSAQNNGQSTEDGLQGVTDTTNSLPDNQKISEGKENLVTLNHPGDPLEYTYITKKGNSLNAKKYTVASSGSMEGSKTVYISPDMTDDQFESAKIALGKNAMEIMGIAQAWSNGASYDLLKTSALSEGISEGSLTAYLMSKTFAQNYPLENSQQSYHVMVSPGGGDDNAPITLLDVAPLKWVKSGSSTYYSYYALNNGNPTENAYIRWDKSSNTGILVLWKQNESLKNQFTAETGIILNSDLGELQFSNWLLNKLKNNESLLVQIESVVSLNKNDFDYLWLKGIDKTYIYSLTPLNQPYKFENIFPTNDYANMFNKGEEAALIAQQLLGFEKGDSNIAVITSAGYSLVNGISTSGALDGIKSYMEIPLRNLMSLQVGNWIPLWFAFIKKESNGLNAVLITNINENLVISSWNGMFVFDISAEALKDDNYARNTVYNFLGGGKFDTGYYQQDYFIVGLANAWAHGMPYEFQKASLEGFFPCSGLCQRTLTAIYLMKNYKLGPDEEYILISPAAHHDIPFMDLLGVSPAAGTYFTSGVSNSMSDPNAAAILVIWNLKTQTGKAVLVDLNQAAINSMQDQDLGVNNYYYKTMYWALWYLDTAFYGQRANEINAAFSVIKDVQITRKDLQVMITSGNDPVIYLKNLNYLIPSNPTNPSITYFYGSKSKLNHLILINSPQNTQIINFIPHMPITNGLLISSVASQTIKTSEFKDLTQNTAIPVEPPVKPQTQFNDDITNQNYILWYILALFILLIPALVYLKVNIRELMAERLKGL